MAHKKFSAAHKRQISEVMKAARSRKPTGRKVHFTKNEKDTLRRVMQEHHSSTTRHAAPKKRKAATTRKATTRKTIKRAHHVARKSTRGRKAGFHHSPATRKKMAAAHKARWAKHGNKYRRAHKSRSRARR